MYQLLQFTEHILVGQNLSFGIFKFWFLYQNSWCKNGLNVERKNKFFQKQLLDISCQKKNKIILV
ncbi:hypothetical protein BpHYR1_022097 [Brachionus plicatilis]|uniref:Uncharacterized protein n=1 Tax=Brachionus plicatilis TaxID=10195 RepID=A0A3M7SV20_BRAPC|nr:hypothetical protein BpHYR1_022097 [Brachionus plicatilis]